MVYTILHITDTPLQVTFPSKTYTSPLDEVTNRRTAATAASFQFSSDEEDQSEADRKLRKSLSPERVQYRSGRSSSSERWSHR